MSLLNDMYNVRMTKASGRPLALFLFLAFVIVNLYGATYGLGMQKDAQGKMSGCMFSGTTICTMTAFEHLAAWQSAFTATVSHQALSLLALLLLAVTLFAAYMAMRMLFNAVLALLEAHQKLYARRAFAISHVNPLQELFSQGILNPKTY